MSTAIKPLEELIRELPPSLRAEVRDFVEFLLAKRGHPSSQRLRQDWAGALQAYRDQYTSVELQHHSLKWRSD
jgi:hypothetical protein